MYNLWITCKVETYFLIKAYILYTLQDLNKLSKNHLIDEIRVNVQSNAHRHAHKIDMQNIIRTIMVNDVMRYTQQSLR